MSEINTYRVTLVIQSDTNPAKWLDWETLVCSEPDERVMSVFCTELVGTHACVHCGRQVVETAYGWADPKATGDDHVWFWNCEGNDTLQAPHEVTA